MNRVILSAHLCSQLTRLTQPVELCDESGLVLGSFIPRLSDNPEQSCPYSEDELRQLRAQPGGRPLTEIWRSLADK